MGGLLRGVGGRRGPLPPGVGGRPPLDDGRRPSGTRDRHHRGSRGRSRAGSGPGRLRRRRAPRGPVVALGAYRRNVTGHRAPHRTVTAYRSGPNTRDGARRQGSTDGVRGATDRRPQTAAPGALPRIPAAEGGTDGAGRPVRCAPCGGRARRGRSPPHGGTLHGGRRRHGGTPHGRTGSHRTGSHWRGRHGNDSSRNGADRPGTGRARSRRSGLSVRHHLRGRPAFTRGSRSPHRSGGRSGAGSGSGGRTGRRARGGGTPPRGGQHPPLHLRPGVRTGQTGGTGRRARRSRRHPQTRARGRRGRRQDGTGRGLGPHRHRTRSRTRTGTAATTSTAVAKTATGHGSRTGRRRAPYRSTPDRRTPTGGRRGAPLHHRGRGRRQIGRAHV